jgi:hypothetical membrane protein
MDAQRVLGVIIIVTAFVVCIPVILQVREGEEKLRDMWGFLLFASGLLAVGVAYTGLVEPARDYAVYGGLAAALVGLFVQHRERRSGNTG